MINIKKLADLAQLEFSDEEAKKIETEIGEFIKNITSEQILDAAWTASALARIDGLRFEPSYKNAKSCTELYKKTRTNYFDYETKKKILTGYFVVLEENYNNYFGKAWNKNNAQEVSLDNLRDDVVSLSLPVEDIMKRAPKHSDKYFVVPQVVD